MRFDSFEVSARFGLDLMRGRSWIGGFSMKSTSLASSAATREAELVIGRSVTFFHFGFSPQCVSFVSMTMRSPGVNCVYLNGPVPAYFILLKSSVLGQAVTPSQPALLNFRSSGAPASLAEMIAMLLTVIAISGNGSVVVMTSV